jgi:hypothetical protein
MGCLANQAQFAVDWKVLVPQGPERADLSLAGGDPIRLVRFNIFRMTTMDHAPCIITA